jgi:hypothetical protein
MQFVVELSSGSSRELRVEVLVQLSAVPDKQLCVESASSGKVHVLTCSG